MGRWWVVARDLGAAPQHADLVYAYRPLAELPLIVAAAQSMEASTVWIQSGATSTGARDPTGCWLPEDESRRARQLVESAGLAYIDHLYIADAVRHLGPR